MSHARWRKSSRSDANSGCVEAHGSLTAIRDSKYTKVSLQQVDVARLIEAAKSNAFVRSA